LDDVRKEFVMWNLVLPLSIADICDVQAYKSGSYTKRYTPQLESTYLYSVLTKPPKVIQDFNPEFFLSVTWPSNKSASLGNVIKPSDVDEEPAVFLYRFLPPTADLLKISTFTIAMTDPDAPSNSDPKWAEFCHWIVTGVQVTAAAKRTSLKDIMPYQPPTPPSKTGFHRYVFLAFLPQNGTDSKKLHLSKPSGRKRWGTGKERHGVRDWAGDNGLVPAGKFYFRSISG
jgi:hypothetical protein